MSHASQRFYDDPRFMRGLRTVTRPIAWGAALLSGLLLVYLGGVPLFFKGTWREVAQKSSRRTAAPAAY